MKIITHNPEETIELGRRIGERLHEGDFIAYTGDFGVGKTTLTRGIVMGLGGDEDTVFSPTYAIVNEYKPKNCPGLRIPVYHFDMCRVLDMEGLEATGFYDYPLDESIFIIEWTEVIQPAIPKDAIRINMVAHEYHGPREIEVKGDERF